MTLPPSTEAGSLRAPDSDSSDLASRSQVDRCAPITDDWSRRAYEQWIARFGYRWSFDGFNTFRAGAVAAVHRESEQAKSTEAEVAALSAASPLPEPKSDSVDLAVASKVDRCASRGLDTPERVRFYEHDFYPLSNFSAFTLFWRGIRFDTSEAAYHFEKFPHEENIRNAIIGAPSAHEAFKIAERHKGARRKDWDAIKVGLMRDILRAKVEQHEYVRRKLLATGERELVEDSWRDDFWGWGPNCDGQNMLGTLWMELRAALRTSEQKAAPADSRSDNPDNPEGSAQKSAPYRDRA